MNYIWIDRESTSTGAFSVVKFTKSYKLNGAKGVNLRVCADSSYMLYVNGKFIGRGPVSPGADFLMYDSEYRYYSTYSVILDSDEIEISALVTASALVLTEYPSKQPFLFLDGELFSNEKKIEIATDTTWEAEFLSERVEPLKTDYRLKTGKREKCKLVNISEKIEPSQIENLAEKKITPRTFSKFKVDAKKSLTAEYELDKIYSAYPYISIKSKGDAKITIESCEIDGVGYISEEVYTGSDVVHTSSRMRAIGKIKITVENMSNSDVIIDDVSIISSMYKTGNESKFKCSSPLLNSIYDICMHTLKICRQSIHLDSPTHQEFLACTGDYYIQALMEYMNVGDRSLTRFDIYRTAKIIELQKGVMFHTTYSLIYPEWIYDYYMHTADKTIFKDTEKSIELLLAKFDTYLGENGLIEYAPNYMFVDWIMVNDSDEMFDTGADMMTHGKLKGFSMHHPPKALGQSALCMFYYNALIVISKIYDIIKKPKEAEKCRAKAEALKNAINTHLFDKEKGLYVGGLNTEDRVENSEWLPKNTKRKFYLKQANTLAVLYGICEEEYAKSILKYVLDDLKKVEMQPYFYHFLLEALYKNDMLREYGIPLIEKYKSLLEKCDKGLCEAWEGVNGDCSHAWGGTPAYILKRAISGIEIIEPGYKKIKLSLDSLGLDKIEMTLPTPYGEIEIKIDGSKKEIKAPKEITII